MPVSWAMTWVIGKYVGHEHEQALLRCFYESKHQQITFDSIIYETDFFYNRETSHRN